MMPMHIAVIPYHPSNDLNKGMVGWWKCNEGEGMITADASEVGNTMSIGNVWVDGKSGYGSTLHFTAANCHCAIVCHAASMTPSAAISITAWAKSDSATGWDGGSFISKSNCYFMGPNSGGGKTILFKIGTANGWIQATWTPAEDFDFSAWHHYAGTFDGKTICLYVDGAPADGYPLQMSAKALPFVYDNWTTWIGTENADF